MTQLPQLNNYKQVYLKYIINSNPSNKRVHRAIHHDLATS